MAGSESGLSLALPPLSTSLCPEQLRQKLRVRLVKPKEVSMSQQPAAVPACPVVPDPATERYAGAHLESRFHG